MARIRSIKPELPSDRTLASCSFQARYTFLLIISQADDYGLLEARPRQLLGSLFPHDEQVTERQVLGWVQELVNGGRLRWRETFDGAPILEVVNWRKHQIISKPGKPLLLNMLRPLSDDPQIFPGNAQGISRGFPGSAQKKLCADRERDLGEGKGKGSNVLSDELEKQFVECWESYPKRPNNSRAKARDAWITGIKRGASPDAMLQGTKAYAAYVDRERIEPRFVKQAATFYGPKEHWLDDYGPAPRRMVQMYTESGDMPPEIAALGGAR